MKNCTFHKAPGVNPVFTSSFLLGDRYFQTAEIYLYSFVRERPAHLALTDNQFKGGNRDMNSDVHERFRLRG